MTTAKDDGERPPDPAEILPEDSVLSFKEYIDMQRALGRKLAIASSMISQYVETEPQKNSKRPSISQETPSTIT